MNEEIGGVDDGADEAPFIEFAHSFSCIDEYDVHQLRKMNAMKVGELASMGIGMDPMSLVMTRLESFIDHVLPEHEESRWAFEKAYETFIGGRLDAAATEARKATIMQGISSFGRPNGG